MAEQSGSRYFTLAFLETLSKSSGTLAWNGKRSNLASRGTYVSDIAELRSVGGDVIPSFGGWSADQAGREIGDSCKNVRAIFSAYKALVTSYDVTRLDLDIEGRSLHRPNGIDRRNKAIKLLQDWAAATGRPLQVSYTLPTSALGLEPSGLAVLRNAKANGVRVDVVNIMTFDYYDRITTDMGGAAITAAEGLIGQLQTLYGKAREEVTPLVGITLMPGVDDYPPRTERTSLADVQLVVDYAMSNGFNTLSIWAVQRDDGRILQQPWAFSDVLNPFTH
jgi:hypothetical protein